jgi:hypothetical protein
VTSDDCGDRGPAAPETKGEPELLAGKMRVLASPRRTEAEVAGMSFDEVDKLLDGLRRDRRLTVSTVVEATASEQSIQRGGPVRHRR